MTHSTFNITSFPLILIILAFASQYYITPVSCIAPPHPDYLEEHKRKRRRLRLQDNVTEIPPLQQLAPELCHGLSRDECLQLDDSYVHYTDKTRKLIQTTGVVRTLVLCVRFSDHVGRELPPKEDIEALWNSREALDILPTGSISEFLRVNSYSNFQLQADVYDWIVTDGSELDYSGGISGLTRELASAMYPVLTVIDGLGADFSKYDLDGDGVIDSLVLLHSGYPAELGKLDCTNGRSNDNRIWSHAIGSFDNKWMSNDGQYTLGGYMVASALRGTCSGNLARIGVMTHEFIHTWGIPDLYDTSGAWIGKGVGSFDLMSNPYGLDGAQTHPNNMGPWVKIQSGWLEPIEITQDGEYIIEASAINPSVYIIKDKFPNDEYILIENRQPIGWDELLWEGGLLIWHIDDNADNNRERGYPGQFGWPGNGRHYRVAVAAGDRNYDLEKGNNNGDEFDFWVSGQELTPGVFEYEATDHSQYPNTNSYMFGSIWPTGIRIYDISQSDTVMTFKVEGLSPAEPPTPNPSWSPTPPLPTWSPSASPTKKPTPGPTQEPSGLPTSDPTATPTGAPSQAPIPTMAPVVPTDAPVTASPTARPVTENPVAAPVPASVIPPVAAPVPASVIPPVAAPVPAPIIPPVADPVPAPVAAPVPAPVAAPVPVVVPVTTSAPDDTPTGGAVPTDAPQTVVDPSIEEQEAPTVEPATDTPASAATMPSFAASLLSFLLVYLAF